VRSRSPSRSATAALLFTWQPTPRLGRTGRGMPWASSAPFLRANGCKVRSQLNRGQTHLRCGKHLNSNVLRAAAALERAGEALGPNGASGADRPRSRRRLAAVAVRSNRTGARNKAKCQWMSGHPRGSAALWIRRLEVRALARQRTKDQRKQFACRTCRCRDRRTTWTASSRPHPK
jgi:hypothetical protein